MLFAKIKSPGPLSPLPTGEGQNTFKRLYFGLNFLGELAEGAEASVAPLVAPLYRNYWLCCIYHLTPTTELVM